MVGSGQEGIEEGRAFPASDQEKRSDRLSAKGNLARRTFAGGISRAKGLKAKISAANEFLKTLSDIKDKGMVGKEMITALNADIASHQRTQPALALEAILLRDEIRQ